MLSGLTNYVPETALTVFDNLEFFIRIVLAAILGALVGLERSKRQKEAGVRTHCIIACTSALFMILSKYAFVDLVGVAGLRGADPARIAAQVVSGISFLGAGVIFKNGNSIRGLTTAAGMWGTAAVGMAIGAGMYWVGLIEAAVLVGIQIVLHRFPVGADALRWSVNNTKRVRSGQRAGTNTGNFYYAKIEPKSRKTDPFMALVASMTEEAVLGTGEPVKLPPIGAIRL